ncbi:MAG: ATPase [Lachnospiraceae bacterium]|nr:ATPase [Lachnospiraceae bacterium]
MIVKMKFLSITGPKDDIDRVVEEYLSKYEIQLENAVSELKSVQDIAPFVEANPYKDILPKAQAFADALPASAVRENISLSAEDCAGLIKKLDEELSAITQEKEALEEQIRHYEASLTDIAHFKDLHYDIESILHFRHVKFRFGKIAREYFEKFEQYVYADLHTVFHKCQSDKNYVWGVYFVPAAEADQVDAVYSSLHFERFHLKDEYEGTPEQAYSQLCDTLNNLESQLKALDQKISDILSESGGKILYARDRLTTISENFDIRKLAACTTNKRDVFYILCGWMTEEDAIAFTEEIASDEKVHCIVEDDPANIYGQPPTKLKNPKLFKPFEMFVRMYGLPAYDEFDPTIFLALTYSFIFGAMFGDVGQGLVLFIGGALLYKFKKMNLAAIISCAGVFSTFFGFMFGSIFGFEDIIDAVWLRPISNMTQLPFIGNLNTVFVIAIAFGMFLVMTTMIMNIINGLKSHDLESALFGTNGVAGLVFYGAVAAAVFLFMTGHKLPATIVLVVMFVLPLLVIAAKEPLTALIEKKPKLIEGGVGMFITQSFFELFEVLLSYFSNTLSFVRIGAFAVSHAAMMEVVLMLAGAENGAAPNWIVIVLGNLFVCGMEGLIVGIQVLRLEYYEFFSRFYKGTGREFKPYTK